MEKNKTDTINDNNNYVMQFASNLYTAFKGENGMYTPQILNQNMIDLNNNQLVPSVETIKAALSNAKVDATQLQGYSEFMEVFDTMFGKILNYYSNILSFDWRYSVQNIKRDSEFKSQEFKDDLNRMYKFMDNFNYKSEFRKILKNLIRGEIVFSWLRDSHGTIDDEAFNLEYNVKKDSKYTLQMMPQKYCIMTNYFENGLLYDFDLSYFMNPTRSVYLFDPALYKKNKQFIDGVQKGYIVPSAQLNKRNGTFATWCETSPDDGAWAWKFDMSNFNSVPPLASLLKTAFNNSEVQDLQMQKDIASAYSLIVGELRMFEGAKSGTTPNQFSITPQVLGQFMQLIQSGLQKPIKAISMPTENTKFMQYEEKNPEMYKNQIQQSISQGVGASRILYATDKMSISEVENSIINDYNFVKKFYEQCENFLDFYVNKKTRKYKFKFKFDGSIYPFEQSVRKENIKDLATHGIGLNMSAWANAYGYDPIEFDRMQREGKCGSMQDSLFLLMNSNTTSQSDNVGRPRKISGELKTGGEIAREYD